MKKSIKFDYTNLSEKSLGKIVDNQEYLFVSCFAIGLLTHWFGLGLNPFYLYMDLAINICGYICFVVALFFWFRINIKYSFFGSKTLFVLNTIAHIIIVSVFIIDAHFCVTYVSTDHSFGTHLILWPFVCIELPLSFIYFTWFYFRCLKVPSKLRLSLLHKRIAGKGAENRLTIMTNYSIKYYKKLLSFSISKLGLPLNTSFSAEICDGSIVISAITDNKKMILDFYSIITEHDNEEIKLLNTINKMENKSNLSKICDEINEYKINIKHF